LLNELALKEARFRSIIDNAIDLVTVIDSTGNILFQSPSAVVVLGHQPNAMTGKNLKEFIQSSDHGALEKQLDQLFTRPDNVMVFESKWRDSRGHWISMESFGQKMGFDNLAVLNTRDITDRIRNATELELSRKQAESASQAKNMFLANMSHEIRTPLHAVLGMAEMLQETPLTQQQWRYVSAFKTASEHLLWLLNDLLDFSRIEANELKLEEAAIDIREVTKNLFDVMKPHARNKGLGYNLYIQDNFKHWRTADPQRLKQILFNLIGNAIKFTDRGSVTLSVSETTTGKLLFRVMDTGRGITDDQQEKIFNSFHQAHQSREIPQQGTGLGLAICKKLVNAMNGSIRVESIPGQGSCFYCELPLPLCSAPPYQTIIRDFHPSPSTPNLDQLDILVVDDSTMNRMVIREFLGDCGCNLDFCTNGFEALHKLEENSYNIVLMDIRMPGMDGIETTSLLRSRETTTLSDHPLVVIALTAGAEHEDRMAAMQAGCDDCLTKPVSKQSLLETIKHHMHGGPHPFSTSTSV
jgi:PAS domain S-box-containing protein